MKREAGLVRQFVNDLIEGINANDASVCTRLFSQERLKPKERGRAVAACRRGIAQTSGKLTLSKVEVIRINEGKDGARTGFVQFVAQAKGRKTRYRFHIVRTDAGYISDAALAIPKPK